MRRSQAIFCLHGFSGSPRDWDFLNARFRDDSNITLITADIPGHNGFGSDLCGSLSDCLYELEHQIKQIPQDEIWLCGYSMGGRLALLLQERIKTKRICGAILLSTGFGFSSEDEKRERIARDKANGALLCDSPDEFWQLWYSQGIFGNLLALEEHSLSAWLERKKIHDFNALSKSLLAFSPAKHAYLEPKLGEIESVLFLAGEKDIKYFSQANEIRHKWPKISVETIPDVGHSLLWEAPDQVSDIIYEWLKTRRRNND